MAGKVKRTLSEDDRKVLMENLKKARAVKAANVAERRKPKIKPAKTNEEPSESESDDLSSGSYVSDSDSGDESEVEQKRVKVDRPVKKEVKKKDVKKVRKGPTVEELFRMSLEKSEKDRKLMKKMMAKRKEKSPVVEKRREKSPVVEKRDEQPASIRGVVGMGPRPMNLF